MDRYIDELETVLIGIARATPRTASAARRRVSWRMLLVSCAALAGALLVVSAFNRVDSGGDARASAIPALAHADRDLTRGGRVLPAGVAPNMDRRRAYAFAVPSGTGYVLASTDESRICVVIPDPPAGYGSTCATAAEVRERGLVAELVAPAPGQGTSVVVVVLPSGADAPTLRYRDGAAQAIAVKHGVAAVTVQRTGVLTYQAHGAAREMTVRPYEPQGDYYRDCGDGRVVEIHTKQGMTSRHPRECVTG
jgi:hypothetical protein